MNFFRAMTISLCAVVVYTAEAGAKPVSQSGAGDASHWMRSVDPLAAKTETIDNSTSLSGRGAREGARLAYAAKTEKQAKEPASSNNFDLERFLDGVQSQAKRLYSWGSVEFPKFYKAALPKLGIGATSTPSATPASPTTLQRTHRVNTPVDDRRQHWLLNDGRLKTVTRH